MMRMEIVSYRQDGPPFTKTEALDATIVQVHKSGLVNIDGQELQLTPDSIYRLEIVIHDYAQA